MDDYRVILRDYLNKSKLVLNEFVDDIDFESINKACSLILQAEDNGNRVHVTGIGKPSHLAGYVSSLMSSTGTPTYFLDGTECVHGSAGQTKPGDVVIAISNSGNTKELEASVQCLKDIGVKIIGVTSSAKSRLAQESDITLLAGVSEEGDSLNKPPRASILAEMIALQCLSVLLQEHKNLTPEVYVTWHPGGSLGSSIRDSK